MFVIVTSLRNFVGKLFIYPKVLSSQSSLFIITFKRQSFGGSLWHISSLLVPVGVCQITFLIQYTVRVYLEIMGVSHLLLSIYLFIYKTVIILQLLLFSFFCIKINFIYNKSLCDPWYSFMLLQNVIQCS